MTNRPRTINPSGCVTMIFQNQCQGIQQICLCLFESLSLRENVWKLLEGTRITSFGGWLKNRGQTKIELRRHVPRVARSPRQSSPTCRSAPGARRWGNDSGEPGRESRCRRDGGAPRGLRTRFGGRAVLLIIAAARPCQGVALHAEPQARVVERVRVPAFPAGQWI